MTSRRPTTPNPTDPCPCGSGNALAECCGKYISGEAHAPTAETLMRSRYTAFAVMDDEYLTQTWHPDHRPTELDLDPDQTWLRLEILTPNGAGCSIPTASWNFALTTHSGASGECSTNAVDLREQKASGSTSTAISVR